MGQANQKIEPNKVQEEDEVMKAVSEAIEMACNVISRNLVRRTETAQLNTNHDRSLLKSMQTSTTKAMQKLRNVFQDGSPNSLHSLGFSKADKDRMFATLTGGLDVIHELHDREATCRRYKSLQFIATLAVTEALCAIQDVMDHLDQIQHRITRQPGFPYRPVGSLGEIRLLILFPDKDTTAEIRCHLIHVESYKDRAYAALSYVWGDYGDKAPQILLEGVPFQVTPNLHAALKHFRHESRRRVLWVDALCINQKDEAEKNHQVSQMQSIFKNANSILMWTGNEAKGSNFAMEWLLEVEQSVDTKTIVEAFRSKILQNHWAVIRDFLQREYWKRVWILQEAIVSYNSLICCGEYGVTWLTMSQLILNGLGLLETSMLTSSWVRGPIPAVNLSNTFRDLYFHAEFSNKYFEKIPIPFLEGLIAGRTCRATDPHDHVFAIMGFIDNSPVQVDYGKPVFKLYHEVSCNIIRQTGSLDILTTCKRWEPDGPKRRGVTMHECRLLIGDFAVDVLLSPDPNQKNVTVEDMLKLFNKFRDPHFAPGVEAVHRQTMLDAVTMVGMACLPSWVPRWDWEIADPYICLDHEALDQFNAASGSLAHFVFQNDDCKLKLAGIHVDVVQSVHIRNSGVAEGDLQRWWNRWTMGTSYVRENRYGDLANQREAFYRTIMTVGRAHKQGSRNEDDAQRKFFYIDMGWDCEDKFDYMAKQNSRRFDFLEYGRKSATSAATLAFLIGEHGYMGLGPRTMKSGDIVCVLLGGKVPFVLRPCQQSYYLIGETCK